MPAPPWGARTGAPLDFVSFHTAVRDGTLTLQVALPLPSVSLLEIRPATR